MTQLVDAWDTRTGQKVKNANGGKVPKAWLDKGLFPHLSAAEPKPDPKAAKAVSGGEKKET